MKKTTTKRFFLPLCLLMLFGMIFGGVDASAEDVTGTITFGTPNVKIDKTSVDANDNQGNTWNIITVTKKSSFTQNATYSQVGSSSNPATSITFTMTLPSEVTFTSVSAKFGGFSGTSGNIALNVGETTIGNGKLNASTDVVVSNTQVAEGNKLTITITNIAKGVKCYYISYTYSTKEGNSQPLEFANPSMEVYDDAAAFTNTLSGNVGAVSYTSKNEDVATVDADGQVTIVGVGTTQITATAAAAGDYDETTKSYTLTVWPTTINGIKKLATATSAGSANAFKARLTNAYITYTNGSNAFLQDGNSAVLIYKSGHGLTPGDCFNGEVSGTAFKYNGLNEINSFDFSAAEQTTITVPAPLEVTMEELAANFDAYESMYLQLKSVTAGADVAAVNSTCKLTQNGVEHTSPVLRAAATITSVKAGNTYDIIAFPGYYNTTKQLNLWTDDHVTKVAGALEVPTAAFGQGNYTAAFGESADLTFTTNSDGEVTYSANPSEGITLTKTETGVTAVASKTGNYTITATVAATEVYAETSVSCDLEVTKKDPEASMTIDPAVVEFGGTSTLIFRMKKGEATTNQVTFAVDGAEDFEGQLDNVAWSEDGDFHVATIHLTAPSNGMEYTFSATVPETDNYSSATVSATLKVVAPSHNLTPTVLYKQITSMDEFVDGGVYLLGCEKFGDAVGVIDASKSRLLSADPITIQKGKDANGNDFNYYQGEVNTEGKPYEITIMKADDGTYNLYHAEGKYINGTTSADLTFESTGNAGWSISFVETTGNIRISHPKYNDAYFQHNSDAKYQYYKNYKGNVAVQLYLKVGEINVHSKMKGYSTYVADFPYVMPVGLTGKTVSVDAAGQMTVTDLFEGGNEVPALTPLLVRTTDTYAEGEEKKSYYPAVLTKEVTVADNVSEELANSNLEYRRKLIGGETWTSTLNATLVNPYYYKLSVDTEGNNPGFYWGTTDGSAFVMKNGSTAYLTCGSAVHINKFIFDENGETTAVEGVLTDGNMPADTVVYNLQGIRVNPNNLQKGIYIINGRKTVVK